MIDKRMVAELKEAGQSIIDNAEKIVGGYEYQCGGIKVVIKLSTDAAPTIDVFNSFIPENYIKRKKNVKRL